MATYLLAKDVLNVEVSCFANYNTPGNPKPVNLYTWLTNTKYRQKVELIRSLMDKAKRDEIKSTLPAITPSGVFTYRQMSALVKHSGVIQFDIDLKDNPHIRNYADLKRQLAKLPFVVYCGLSVSGTGYWGLVPIAHPDRHGQHFDALKRVFAHYKIILDDKPRNVVSLRGYSYDSDGYFAKQVMLFELYDEPKPQPTRKVDYSQFTDQDDSQLLTRLIRYVEGAGEGQRHAMLLKAAKLAGGFIGAGRLDEQTAVYALEAIASEWPMFSKSQKTILDGLRYGQTAPIYLEERITPLKIISKTSSPLTYKTYKSTEEIVERIEASVRVEVTTEQVVTLLKDWRLGLLLRPGEDQLERLIVEPVDTYPAEWDEPNPPDAKPTIRVHNTPESYLSQMGLSSLLPKD